MSSTTWGGGGAVVAALCVGTQEWMRDARSSVVSGGELESRWKDLCDTGVAHAWMCTRETQPGGKEESGERESIRSVVEEWMEMTIRLAVPHGILFGRFSVDDGVRHLVELCDRLPISFASRLLSHLLTWNGKELEEMRQEEDCRSPARMTSSLALLDEEVGDSSHVSDKISSMLESVHAKPETVSESQHTDQSSTREWFRCAVEATFRILRSRGHPLRISEILAHLLKEEENVPVWMGVNHLESLITWSDRVSQLSFQLSCSPPIRPDLLIRSIVISFFRICEIGDCGNSALYSRYVARLVDRGAGEELMEFLFKSFLKRNYCLPDSWCSSLIGLLVSSRCKLIDITLRESWRSSVKRILGPTSDADGPIFCFASYFVSLLSFGRGSSVSGLLADDEVSKIIPVYLVDHILCGRVLTHNSLFILFASFVYELQHFWNEHPKAIVEFCRSLLDAFGDLHVFRHSEESIQKQCIIFVAAAMIAGGPEFVNSSSILPKLLEGIQLRLGAKDGYLRTFGIVIAQVMSQVMRPNDPISFDGEMYLDILSEVQSLISNSQKLFVSSRTCDDKKKKKQEELVSTSSGSISALPSLQSPLSEPHPSLDVDEKNSSSHLDVLLNSASEMYDPATDQLDELDSVMYGYDNDDRDSSSSDTDSSSDASPSLTVQTRDGRNSEDSDVWSDTESLVPYDLGDEDPQSLVEKDDPLAPRVRAPRMQFLGDIIDGLRNTKDVNVFEAAIGEARAVIEKNRENIVLHANALIRALVHARDEFNMEDFHILRGNAVVVAATLCPEIIFPTLCREFFSSSLVLHDRLFVLDCLFFASQELASTSLPSGTASISSARLSAVPSIYSGPKTRIIAPVSLSNRSSNEKKTVNQFPCIVEAFYSLVEAYDSDLLHLEIVDSEGFAFARFLEFLSRLVILVSSSPSIERMCTRLLNLTLLHLSDQRLAVRQAALFGTLISLEMKHASNILKDLGVQAEFLIDAVGACATYDTDETCRALGSSCIHQLQKLFTPAELALCGSF